MTPYTDRTEGGHRLAQALEHELGSDGVVVGLARGGVVVAAEVAAALAMPLDALAVRKVGHPWQPEYAIGAVTPGGGLFLRGRDGLTEGEVAEAVERARERAEELDRRLHAGRPPVDLRGKTCLLVNDGLATGATMVAAVRWAKAQGASRVVVAVPVGAAETVAFLRTEADRVVCLETPAEFLAVGLWYRHFDEVSDAHVVALLRGSPADPPVRQEVTIRVGDVELGGALTVPARALGAVAFAHGSGSSRFSPRNRLVASALNAAGFGTLLLDLLTPAEELDRGAVFDVQLLAERLVAATRWLRGEPEASGLALGYFGASTGAAAALWAAADLGDEVRAVVSRGGRPDLASPRLAEVTAPTLLVVGGEDRVVLELNRQALAELRCERTLEVVPRATHLFEEPGALERVADLAVRWFARHLHGGG